MWYSALITSVLSWLLLMAVAAQQIPFTGIVPGTTVPWDDIGEFTPLAGFSGVGWFFDYVQSVR